MNNKLFIIGNGFDIAHGLETRYTDFILWYFNQAIHYFNNGVSYNDGFILGVVSSKIPLLKIENISQLNRMLDNGKSKTFIFKYPWLDYIKKSLKQNNWVDFEILYYEIIKEINIETKISKEKKIDSITGINVFFDMFKSKLNEYLLSLDLNFKENVGIPFYSHISKNAYQYSNKPIALIINFNYTKTIDQVLKKDFPTNPKNFFNFSETINIHGELNPSKNSIIFGYGDEMDEEYKSLEKLNNNEVLRFMKSFGYLLNRNYKNIEAFTNTNFDVHILGHSCGLSDRLLLNEIFESDGCKNIYFHYWKKSEKENNFIDITMNISRCFNNKTLMRKKLRSFEECVPFIVD